MTTAQIYLQIEQPYTTETKRFQVGQKLKFKIRDFQKEWMRQDIVDLIYDGQSVVFYNQMVRVQDITHIQYHRPFYKNLGTSLEIFGPSLLIMGGAIKGLESIGALESDSYFGWGTVAVGVGSYLSGHIIRKALGTHTRKMGKNNRLVIIDTTF